MGKIDHLFQKALLFIIAFYRRYLAILKRPCCKYYPSCPQYASEAISKYGPRKGTLIAIKRIARCNPFSKGGYDPLK
jgi:hypothetical protein